MMLDKNFLGGSSTSSASWDSKQTMVEPSMVGTSTSGMKETKLSVSRPRSWYARWSSSITVVFLKKSVSSGFSPAAILVAPRVGEEDAIVALSAPESCPKSSALADGATGAAGVWTVVSVIEQWMMKAMEDEKARVRNDGAQ
jgi:hypothetical protein